MQSFAACLSAVRGHESIVRECNIELQRRRSVIVVLVCASGWVDFHCTEKSIIFCCFVLVTRWQFSWKIENFMACLGHETSECVLNREGRIPRRSIQKVFRFLTIMMCAAVSKSFRYDSSIVPQCFPCFQNPNESVRYQFSSMSSQS